MSSEQTKKFIPLKNYENKYEILNQYPFTIRRKKDHYIVNECINIDGYPSINLNCKKINKHIVVANQFIPNPKNLPLIDHINKDRTDYHLTNLRWVSRSENNKNKISARGVKYKFVDSLPNDAIKVNYYGKHQFSNLYFCNDLFYIWNGVAYRKLYNNKTQCGNFYVCIRDTNNQRVNVFVHIFKMQHNLI